LVLRVQSILLKSRQKKTFQLRLPLIKPLLGHKSILNTMIYVNLERAIFEVSDDYVVKTASTVDEASKLLEVGFEYVTDMDGRKLFRKRK
jgi:hypothetical protein